MYQHDNRPVRVDGVTKILVTGLVTLDLIFRLQHLPKFGEKYLATDIPEVRGPQPKSRNKTCLFDSKKYGSKTSECFSKIYN